MRRPLDPIRREVAQDAAERAPGSLEFGVEPPSCPDDLALLATVVRRSVRPYPAAASATVVAAVEDALGVLLPLS